MSKITWGVLFLINSGVIPTVETPTDFAAFNAKFKLAFILKT